ncbi:MAG: hypothetical protein ACRDD1_13560, partial [Planctomycetia bacterium]
LGDGSPVYLLTIPDLVGLFYIPAVGSTDPVTLEMIARNIVTGAESEQKPLVVTLQAPTVAAAPTVSVQPAAGVAGAAIPLAVSVNAPALEAGQSVRVRIDGVPTGAVLSAGSLAGATWFLTPSQLAGLSIRFPANSAGGPFPITAAADVVDAANAVRATSPDADFVLTVARANTAPRFQSGRPRLNGVTSRNGVAVRSLLVGAADSEQPAVGVAVVGLRNAGRGKWQFKTTGAWKNVTGRLSDRRALLLPSNARLKFVPAAGNKPGRLQIKLRAWDQTTGAAATFAAATPFGGASAFSSTVRTLSVTLARSAAVETTSRSARLLSVALVDAVFTSELDD